VLPAFVARRVRLYLHEWRALERGARRAWLRGKLDVAKDIVRTADPFRGDRRELDLAAVVAANARAAALFRPRPYAGRVALALAHERPLAGARNHRLDWLAWLPQAGKAMQVPGRDTGEIFRAPQCEVVAAFLERCLADVERTGPNGATSTARDAGARAAASPAAPGAAARPNAATR
jgi:hypothetical protein